MEGREGARHPCPQIQILGKGRTGNWPGPGLGGGWMEGRPRRRPRGAREREGKEKKASSRGAMECQDQSWRGKQAGKDRGRRESQKTAEKTAKKTDVFLKKLLRKLQKHW